MSARQFDIVIFGATGFSGKLLSEYLVKHYSANTKLALAGRNKERLLAVRSKLSEIEPLAADLPILIGNADNLEELTAIAVQTTCIASTVGPYAKYGTPLVEACARSGTHYCDLTGESNWHATMFNKFEAIAQQTGARIVPQCGFDSVPSDVGTFVAANSFKKQHDGAEPTEVQMYVSLRGGGVQGGTIDTVINEITNGAAVARAKKESAKSAPALPCRGKTRLQWIKGIFYSGVAGKWAVPFFMAGANQTYVSRSNGRLGYSSNLVYSEAQMFGSFIKALIFYLSLLVGGILLYLRPTRWLLMKFVLPAPGQGPTMATCEKASYRMQFYASAPGRQTKVTIDAVGDASCISTTCCLAESAMALSRDAAKLTSPGGVQTAMSAMGDVLVDRLQATPLFKIETVADSLPATSSKM